MFLLVFAIVFDNRLVIYNLYIRWNSVTICKQSTDFNRYWLFRLKNKLFIEINYEWFPVLSSYKRRSPESIEQYKIWDVVWKKDAQPKMSILLCA